MNAELLQPDESNERWLQLKAEGKFDLQVANQVSTPLKDQCALAKNLDDWWKNKDLLPSIQSEKKYSGEATTVLKMIKLLNPINMLATGNNALANATGMKYVAEKIINDPKLQKWKLVEFRNIVDMAAEGEFGVIYNRVDLGVFYEWIGKYDAMRCNKLCDEKEKEQKRHYDDLNNMHPEVAKELLKAFPKQPEKITSKSYSSPEDFLNDNPLILQQFIEEYSQLSQPEKDWYESQKGFETYKLDRAVMVMKHIHRNQ